MKMVFYLEPLSVSFFHLDPLHLVGVLVRPILHNSAHNYSLHDESGLDILNRFHIHRYMEGHLAPYKNMDHTSMLHLEQTSER